MGRKRSDTPKKAKDKAQTAQDVPKEVRELVEALAAQAQPRLEELHTRSVPPGVANAPGFALPAFGGPLRTILLQLLEMGAAAARQTVLDYVTANRDAILAKYGPLAVTLISGVLGAIPVPAAAAPAEADEA